MSESASPAPGSRLAQLETILHERFKLFEDLVARGISEFGAAWADELEMTIGNVFPEDDRLVRAVEGYVAFVMDTMRRQRAFERELEYPEVSYEEAAQSVYLDESYMLSQYLPGLLLSHYLWPHHYRLLRFFDSAFASELEVAGADEFVEVAVGTGIYSRRLLQRLPGIRGTGFDISPAVKEFATLHLAGFGLEPRYCLRLEDVIAGAGEQASWIVCVELLEHLEDPIQLLVALRQLLRQGGRAFISTALNAPSPDHIYLYRDQSEVVAHIEQAGFALEQSFCAPAFAPRGQGSVAPSVAAFIVG